MKGSQAAVGAVFVVILLLGSSVGVAAVNAPVPVLSQIGKALLNIAPQQTSGSSLILQGAIYNADGTLNTTTAQSSSPLSPMALIAPGTGGGGTGSCTTVGTPSTSVQGQGFGWGIAVKPQYNGTATSMQITGSYIISVDGGQTSITKTFSYNQVIASGQTVTIKPRSEDITATQLVSAASNKPGQHGLTAPVSVTMVIGYANGATLTLTGTGTGSGTVSITQTTTGVTTYCATALTVSATGGTFTG